MRQYLDLVERVLNDGVEKTDRTGTGTLSVFGHQMRFDLSKGFPLMTTKKLSINSIVVELLWFLRGDTNTTWLNERGCTIWDEWAATEDIEKTIDEMIDEQSKWLYTSGTQADFTRKMLSIAQDSPEQLTNFIEVGTLDVQNKVQEFMESIDPIKTRKGDLGPVYGKQWRSWETTSGECIDQLSEVIQQIKSNPDSRRLIVSAWNVGDVKDMALPSCHILFQFYVADGKLSCQLYQRSVDIFLGLPFNIASYALLTHMIAKECGLEVGEFVWTGGDCHIYSNHIEQMKLQLTREPKPLCQLKILSDKSIFDYEASDFEFVNYDAHQHIKGKVAV